MLIERFVFKKAFHLSTLIEDRTYPLVDKDRKAQLKRKVRLIQAETDKLNHRFTAELSKSERRELYLWAAGKKSSLSSLLQSQRSEELKPYIAMLDNKISAYS